jgi:hypothetical protein
MRTLPEYINTGKGGGVEAFYLVWIKPESGDPWWQADFAFGTRKITVSNFCDTEGNLVGNLVFKGHLLTANNPISTIRQSIDVQGGGNVANLHGASFRLCNPAFAGDPQASPVRGDEFMFDTGGINLGITSFLNRNCNIYLAMVGGGDTVVPFAQILLLYAGSIDEDPSYDLGVMEFKLRDRTADRHKEIPDLTINKATYPAAPVTNQGKVVPLAYGDLNFTGENPIYSTLRTVPSLRYHRGKERFMVARNKVTAQSPSVYIYDSGVNRYVLLSSASSFTITPGRPSYLSFPLGVDIYGTLVTQLEIQGTQTNPTTLDIDNAIDDSHDTVVNMAASLSQRLYLKAPMPAEFGKSSSGTYDATLYVDFGDIPDDGSTGKIRLYDPETASYTDLYTYTHADSGDLKSVVISGKTWQELASYEYGVTPTAGEAGVCNMYLVVTGLVRMTQDKMAVKVVPGRRGRRVGRTWGHVDVIEAKAFNSIEESDTIGTNLNGGQFGAWIDESGRSNPYDEGELVHDQAFIIEAILQDELGLTNEEIDTYSFDVMTEVPLSEAERHPRKNWVFAGMVTTQRNSRSVIADICYEAGLIYFTDYRGKEKVVALATRKYDADDWPMPVVKTIDRSTIELVERDLGGVKSLIENIQVSRTSSDDIYNQFEVYYGKRWEGSGYAGMLYLNESGSNAWTNVRYGTPNTFSGLCAQSQTDNQIVRKLTVYCDWINRAQTGPYDLPDTARRFLHWLAEWFCYSKWMVGFTSAALDHLDLELGDQVKIDHTLLPTAVNDDSHFLVNDVSLYPSKNQHAFELIQLPDLLP